MSREKPIVFNEGIIKKGGQNPPPSSYRPPPPPSFKLATNARSERSSKSKPSVDTPAKPRHGS